MDEASVKQLKQDRREAKNQMKTATKRRDQVQKALNESLKFTDEYSAAKKQTDINVYNQSTFEISVSRYALNGKTEDQSKVFRFSVSKDDYEKLVREINSRFERCEAEDNQT